VVLHEHFHGNSSPYSLTQTCNLPIRAEQRNIGAVGSSTSMKLWCMALWSETNIDVRTLAAPDQHTFNFQIPTLDDVGTEYYIGTLSPVLIKPLSGKKNKSIYFPTRIECTSYDSVTAASVPVEFYAYVDAVISEPNWHPNRFNGFVDYDHDATWYGGGRAVIETYIIGQKVIDLTSVFDSEAVGSFRNYAESGGTVTIPILSITKSSPAVVTYDYPITLNREGEQMTIFGVNGMTQINGAQVYPKHVSINSVELYQDESLTTPYSTTSFSDYTSGGFSTGLYGERVYFVCAVKKLFNNTNPVNVHMQIVWKELIQ
jgi:hypothetical protein